MIQIDTGGFGSIRIDAYATGSTGLPAPSLSDRNFSRGEENSFQDCFSTKGRFHGSTAEYFAAAQIDTRDAALRNPRTVCFNHMIQRTAMGRISVGETEAGEFTGLRRAGKGSFITSWCSKRDSLPRFSHQ